MDHTIKTLIKAIHEKDVRDLVLDHVRGVTFDETKKEVTALVDKRYTMNLLQSAHYISHFISGIQKCFGQEIALVLRLDHPHHAHEREMLIPHMVHY